MGTRAPRSTPRRAEAGQAAEAGRQDARCMGGTTDAAGVPGETMRPRLSPAYRRPTASGPSRRASTRQQARIEGARYPVDHARGRSMPEPSRNVPVVSLGGRGPWPTRILVAVAVFLAVAVVKPWQGPPPAPAAVPSQAPRSTRPPASPAPTAPAAEPFEASCFAGGGWTVTTLEGPARNQARTWYSVQPAPATGPLDPRIPVTRVYSLDIRTLGYCVARPASPLPVIAATSAWQVTGTLATEVRLVRVAAESPADANRGSSFVPASPPAGAPATQSASPTPTAAVRAPTVGRPPWPPGRFVFRVDYQGGRVDADWFAVDIIPVPNMVSGTPSPPARSPAP